MRDSLPPHFLPESWPRFRTKIAKKNRIQLPWNPVIYKGEVGWEQQKTTAASYSTREYNKQQS